MSDQINLLQEKTTVKKEKSVILRISLIILIFASIISIFAFLVLFYLKNQEAKIVSDQANSLNALTELKEKKILYMTVKERLSALQKIFSTNTKIYNRLQDINAIIPEGIEVKDVKADYNKYSFTLISSNLAPLNTFLEEHITSSQVKKINGVQRITVDSVGIKNIEKQYTVSVTFEFK